jgi:hypothetical protein
MMLILSWGLQAGENTGRTYLDALSGVLYDEKDLG